MNIFRILTIIRAIKEFNLEQNAILPIKILIRILFWFQPRDAKVSKKRFGKRLAYAFESLGPVFIKFGQLLSIRTDIVGEAVSSDLVKLQDNCSFVEFSQIKKTIESSFAAPLDEIFLSFDKKAVASASIAQVHYAVLKNNKKVAVKVIKADIEGKIKSDVAILKVLSGFFDWINRYRGIELKSLVKQFEKLIHWEMDMKMEAANASLMAKKLELVEWVKIPEIHWKYLRQKVLVMERFSGISINNIKKIEEMKLDKNLLAYRGLELVLKQIFQHNFFHADLHPGNILVNENAEFLLVDFGLVGSLNQNDRQYLANNYLALFKHDYASAAENHIASGWVPKDTNALEFQAHLRMVIEPLSKKSLKDISMAKILLTLFIVARKFNMKVPHELALVDKTLLQIESIGKKLNPNLNVWQVMEPLVEGFVIEQKKSTQSINDLKSKLSDSLKSWLVYYPLAERHLKDQLSASQDKFKQKSKLNWKQSFIPALFGAVIGALIFSFLI